MSIIDFLILSLATWRVSSLLVEEEGPHCIFSKLRDWIDVKEDEEGNRHGENELGYVFSCIWCMSLWVGLAWFTFWLLAPRPAVFVATPLALTALGTVIHGRGIRYRKH